ncbi:MAG TPA: iron-containing alcohol dehydrogenase PsrA [Casimicrobiaceae bacterium]|nr:iron-containing alcohol dehydrogenase PsrA [Casimicrobiaceae bacterium]
MAAPAPRWKFHNPVAVAFGSGCLAQLPDRLGRRGAVVVTFAEAEALGLHARLEQILGERLRGFVSDIAPNPDVAELRGLYGRFWRDYGDCQAIVAVGGGSALDAAKVLLAGTADGAFGDLEASLAGGRSFVPHGTKALITVPTTAGTGSEVTPWATVWDRGAHRKYSLQLDATWPEAAFVDPELTMTLPASVTLHSGLDALSHALESIWNVNANPVSDALAVAAAKSMMAALPALMREPRSAELRARASQAALQAGLAFSNTKTALAHSLSYEMTLSHGLPHGIACSFTLPLVLERARGRDAARDAVLAQVFPCPLDEAGDWLRAFLESLGVSPRFETYGVAADESARMIADALEGPRGRNFIGA